MNVTFITTVHHNVGDDFVREGIVHLLKKVLGSFHIELIHKHLPITARPECDWFYPGPVAGWIERLPGPSALGISKRLDLIALNPATDRVLSADLLIQSGAPVYWLHGANSCASTEWYAPLIERRWAEAGASRIPLMNLAAGTCQAYPSDGHEFTQSPETLEHIRKFSRLCCVTTLRDQLSAKVLAHAGVAAPVLPCTSIFARRGLGFEPASPEYVALNYMPAGGHYTFGQDINPAKWEETFAAFARWVAKQTRCVLVCHNKKEHLAARRILPEIETFYSEDHAKMLRFYSGARFGILNRVHGAFAIASYNRPSIVIGTDSRACMAEMIGLKHYFVSDMTLGLLQAEYKRLDSERMLYPELFGKIAARAEQEYSALLEQAMATRR